MHFTRVAKVFVSVALGVAGAGACTAHSLSAAPIDGPDTDGVSDAASDADACYTPSASPACGYDAAPTAEDGGSGCTFGRAFLNCKFSGGVSALCATDEASCDVSHIGNPGDLVCCTNACAPNEYGASCAGVASPGPRCRNVGIAPGGHGFYCCTCE